MHQSKEFISINLIESAKSESYQRANVFDVLLGSDASRLNIEGIFDSWGTWLNEQPLEALADTLIMSSYTEFLTVEDLNNLILLNSHLEDIINSTGVSDRAKEEFFVYSCSMFALNDKPVVYKSYLDAVDINLLGFQDAFENAEYAFGLSLFLSLSM